MNNSIIDFLKNISAGFISFSAITAPKFTGGKKTIRILTNGESDEILRVVYARGIVGAKWENVVQNAAKREGTENEENYKLSKTPIVWVAGALAKHYLDEKYYLRIVHPKVFKERYFYRANGKTVYLNPRAIKFYLYQAPVSEKVSSYVGSEEVPQFRNYSLENVMVLHAAGKKFTLI